MNKKNIASIIMTLIFLFTAGLMFAFFYWEKISLGFLVINTIVDTLLIAFLKSMRNSKIKVLTSLLYVFCLVVLLVDVFYHPFYNTYIDVSKTSVINGWSTVSIILEAIKDYAKGKRFILIASMMVMNLILFFVPSLEKLIISFDMKRKEESNMITSSVIKTFVFIVLVLLFVFVMKMNDIYRSIYESTAEVVYVKTLYKTMKEEENENEKYVPKVNAYTGIARGRNVYIVQCESLQNFAINRKYNGKEITPNLNKLIKGSTIYFDNCHSQISNGNTSDAEFMLNTGFYPIYKSSVYLNSSGVTFKDTLPEIMKKNGYVTSAFHGYKDDMWNRQVAWKSIGYENISLESSYDIDETVGFGLSDRSFFNQTIKKIKDIQSESGKKTFNVLITLSSHTPFNIGDEYGDIDIKEEDKDSLFGNYINSISYLDECIGEFITLLKENDMYDDSIIVFYGDHHAINCWNSDGSKVEELTGLPYGYPEYSNIPFIVHIPGKKVNTEVTKLCGEVDIMPTVLNLLGIENLSTMSGRDVLLDEDVEYITGINYAIAGSFISDKYVFMKDRLLSNENSYIYDRIKDKQLFYGDLDVNTKASIDALSEKAMQKYFRDNVYYNNHNIIIEK